MRRRATDAFRWLAETGVPVSQRELSMNHKRKRPKNRRSGCLMCKPWKVNGFATERKDGEKFSDHRRRKIAEIQAKEGCFA